MEMSNEILKNYKLNILSICSVKFCEHMHKCPSVSKCFLEQKSSDGEIYGCQKKGDDNENTCLLINLQVVISWNCLI